MTEQQQSTRPSMRPPLRRSKDDRVVAGVCGGLARTLGIDPIIVRVLVAAFTLAGGAGLFAYVVAWILIPDDDGASVVENARGGSSRAGKFFLALVLAAAGLAIVSSFNPGGGGTFGFFLFVLIAVVAWQAFGDDWFRRTTAPAPVDAATSFGDPSVAPAAVTAPAPTPSSPLGRIVFNLAVLVVGVLLALNWAGATAVSGSTVIAIVLGLAGLGLLVSAFVGRARGLIALGIVAGMLGWPSAMHWDSGAGTQVWRPLTVETHSFDLGVGTATLDLRSLASSMEQSEEVTIHAHVGVGELRVLLPADAIGTVITSVSLGSIKSDASPTVDGWQREHTFRYGGGAVPTIDVVANVGVGDLTIVQNDVSANTVMTQQEVSA